LAGLALGSGFTADALAVGVEVAVASNGSEATSVGFLALAGVFTIGAVDDALGVAFAFAFSLGLTTACSWSFTAVAVADCFAAGVDALVAGFFAATALGGVALAVLAFTVRLLVETLGAWVRGRTASFSANAGKPGASAREFTGNPEGKPISFSSVTNIVCPVKSACPTGFCAMLRCTKTKIVAES
jgi:hypothetical protein